MGLTSIDWLIMAVYSLFVVGIGVALKQSTEEGWQSQSTFAAMDGHPRRDRIRLSEILPLDTLFWGNPGPMTMA